jgi:hypothetical protein
MFQQQEQWSLSDLKQILINPSYHFEVLSPSHPFGMARFPLEWISA